MGDKAREKEIKDLMKETMGFIESRMAAVEKSIAKYADKKLAK
jgi:hypothetical protein